MNTDLNDEKQMNHLLADCPICTLPFTGHKRSSMICCYCKFECCKNCNKKYIMTKTQPQCINCNAVWSEEFLEEHFTLSWIDGDLRHHLTSSLFDQEKSMLALASRELHRRQLIEQRQQLQHRFNIATEMVENTGRRIEHIRATINGLKARLTNTAIVYRENIRRDISIREKQLEDSIFSQTQQRSILEKILTDIETFNNENDEKISVNSVSIRCPKPKCNGFLTAKYYCPVCKENYCRDCHVSQDPNKEHKCDPELVKTIRMLVKETKPCPSCKIAIFKLEGCNMMFCTNCNTPFNWVTGEIEKGRIHNPHYFEWLRKQGSQNPQTNDPQQQAVGNGECAIQMSDIYGIFKERKIQNDNPEYEKILRGFRLLIHVEDVMMRPPLPEYQNRHMELRIQFLQSKGVLTDDIWKKKLSAHEREFRIRFKYRQLVETLRFVLLDIYRRMKADIDYKMYIEETHAVIDYFNDHSRKLSKRYGRRFFTGIEKETYTEREIEIVETEAPEDFKNVLKALKTFPSISTSEDGQLCIPFTAAPAWFDEDEQRYLTLFQYYQELWIKLNRNIYKIHSLELIQLLTGDPEKNIWLIRLEDIISKRVCSTLKKRTNVLIVLGEMITELIRLIFERMIREDTHSHIPSKTVCITTPKGKVTCGWAVPIVTNIMFPLRINGNSISIDLLMDSNFEIRQLLYRNVDGEQDDISIEDYLFDKDQYRKYTSMPSWIANKIKDDYETYRSYLTAQQMWTLIVERYRYFIRNIHLDRCTTAKDGENGMFIVDKLFAELTSTKDYSRKKLIKKEREILTFAFRYRFHA